MHIPLLFKIKKVLFDPTNWTLVITIFLCCIAFINSISEKSFQANVLMNIGFSFVELRTVKFIIDWKNIAKENWR